ncbi:MAG: hypothetical protein ACYCXX_14740 [Acidiferrobacter thiooxydans]
MVNHPKEPLYKNAESLKPVEKLLDEANAAISDTTRVFSDDGDMNAALAATSGIGAGGAIGFAALYYAGVTGLSAAGITSALAAAGSLVAGGMAAGIAVLAAPAVLLGVGAYAWTAQRNKKRLIQKKEMLLQEVLRKHDGIIRQLKDTSGKNKERIEYLTRLNILLQAAIKDLTGDLGGCAA